MNVLSVREGPVRCPFWLFRLTDKRNPRLSVPPVAGCLLQVAGRYRSLGVMEYWSNGLDQYSSTPSLQHSIGLFLPSSSIFPIFFIFLHILFDKPD